MARVSSFWQFCDCRFPASNFLLSHFYLTRCGDKRLSSSFPSIFTSHHNIYKEFRVCGRQPHSSSRVPTTLNWLVQVPSRSIAICIRNDSKYLRNISKAITMSPTPVSGTLEASNNVNMDCHDCPETVEAKKIKMDTANGDKENQSAPPPPPAVLRFVKMTELAHNPTKGSKFSAGYDLKSAYKATVPARGSCLVKTDIQIQLPSGTYGRVAPRSGLAWKNKIDVGAGVIDEDYRGNVGVILFNHSDEDFQIVEGDRIAQLICEKIVYPEAVEVKSLDESERGEGGFGSTGTNH